MKTPITASFLSLCIAGLGHFYAGHLRRFFLWFGLPLALGILIHLLAFHAFSFWLGLVLLALIRGADVVLAWRSATSPGDFTKPRRWHYVFILVVRVILISLVLLNTTYWPVQFVSLPTPSMEPTIYQGSRWALVRDRHPDALDATVFWQPADPDNRYLSRTVGLPGDSLALVDGRVHVQGSLRDLESTQHLYILYAKAGGQLSAQGMEELGISKNQTSPMSGSGMAASITQAQAEQAAQKPFIDSVRRSKGHPIEGYVNPWDWTSQDFGPLWIPKAGESLVLTPKRVAYYAHYILQEDPTVEQIGNTLQKGGRELTRYTFQNDYYFMVGDNRDNSLDSRWYGLVRDDLILGTLRYRIW